MLIAAGPEPTNRAGRPAKAATHYLIAFKLDLAETYGGTTERLRKLRQKMRDAAAAVLLIETAMPCDRRRVQELTDIAIRVSGIALLFVGTSYAQPTGLVAILDRSDRSMRWREPPDSFRILAIVPTYNEEDIIESTIRDTTIRDTIAQGLEVYLIDNWSTDRTYSLARRFEGRGLVGLERWAVGELRV